MNTVTIDIPDYKKIVLTENDTGFFVKDGPNNIYIESVFEDKTKIEDAFLYYLSLAIDSIEYKTFDDYKKISSFLSGEESHQEWLTAVYAKKMFLNLGWSEDDIGMVYDSIIYETWKETENKMRLKTNV